MSHHMSFFCQRLMDFPKTKLIKRIISVSTYIQAITAKASPISAEVILKSKSGRSIASAEQNITAANIEEFRPAEETIKQAIIHLDELGFAVSPGGITLTISGEPALFEKVFKVKIIIEKQDGNRLTIRTNRQMSIPASLSHLVEKVEFVPPPIFFDRKQQSSYQTYMTNQKSTKKDYLKSYLLRRAHIEGQKNNT